MHEIYVNNKNITKYVGDLGWTSDSETLGVQLNFKVAYSDVNNFPKNLATNGDIVALKADGKNIFVGIVLDVDIDGRNPRGITCMDFAFYLNKNDAIIQYNNVAAHTAIKRLLDKFGIKYVIDAMPVNITKIYKGQKVSEIIKDILEIVTTKTGVKYRMEMRNDVLYIVKQKDLIVTANTKYIANPKRKLSIQEMKNTILVVSDNENAVKISATAEDKNSVKKFGRLQMVHQVKDEEIAASKHIANQLLKQYNKIFEENSVDLIGSNNVRAGRILKIVEPITGMNGNYLIRNVSHKVSGGVHLMSLNLEVA